MSRRYDAFGRAAGAPVPRLFFALLGLVVPLLLQAGLVILIKELEQRNQIPDDLAFLTFLATPLIGFFGFFKKAVPPRWTLLAGCIYLPVMVFIVIVFSLQLVGMIYGLSL